MILYAAKGTSNLGDFLNCLPVLSGLSKTYGDLILILQSDMQRFLGIKSLLEYQPCLSKVIFEDEIHQFEELKNQQVIPFNSWVRQEQTSKYRPIETCRYEIRFKEDYNLKFEVDDDYILQFPEIDINCEDLVVIGDRCDKTTSDKSRSSGLLKNSGKFDNNFFLDYSKDCVYNVNVIKKCKKFVTTFTGVAVIADLLNIEFDLYYEQSFDGWAGQSAIYTYNKHFYTNRKSILKLL